MTDLPTSRDDRISGKPRNLPSSMQLAAFEAFCKREGLDPTAVPSALAAFEKIGQGTTSLVADGAALALVDLLQSDEYVQRLEDEVDAALAGTEKADTLLVLDMLRDLLRQGDDEGDERPVPTFQERLAAGQELRRWYQMSRGNRNRKRLMKLADRVGSDAPDRLADRGREIIRERRGE